MKPFVSLIIAFFILVDCQRPAPRRFGPIVYPGSCATSAGNLGQCRPASTCFSIIEDDIRSHLSECVQPNGDPGYCCPFALSPNAIVSSSSIFPPSQTRTPYVVMPAITVDDMNRAGQVGIQQHQNVVRLEAELSEKGLFVRKNTPEAYHQAFFGSSKRAQKVAKLGFVGLEISIDLYNKFQLNPKQGRDGLTQFELKNTEFQGICPREPFCESNKYRTQDGSCNNLKHGLWGKSFTAFQRFLSPKYIDGVNLPRIASDGGPLPSARAVSAAATPDMDVPHNMFTLLTMQWGQFIDHDLTVTAITKTAKGEGIKCCSPEIQSNPRLRHPECFEIDIPKDDPFYSIHQQTCMEFVRSAPAPRSDCNLGPREQLNQLTAFIDGSMVYGSTHEEISKLRSFEGGRLLALRYNNADLLPRDLNKSEECAQRQNELFCFMAGDERVNEQISLTTMHTIWMREHNRIANELSRLNPEWDDEAVFQEARRIVAAEIQHITYNEFLPLLLGRQVIRAFGLRLEPNGYSYKYDPTVNPSIANAFAAAAYRYGHTLVQGNVKLVNPDNTKEAEVPLSTQFFNPVMMYTPGNLDRFLRGLISTPAQRYDSFVTKQLTNHLFEIPGHGYGLDLVALNIQRGRDHGIPGYNDWREHCGFQRMYSFEDLKKVMNENAVEAFKKLYRNVDDIDLFPAGVAEFSIANATLGPTFACIVAEQFRRLKVGDRFWYENGGQAGSFAEAQLQEIRKVSLARIICDNSDDIKNVQPLAFIGPMQWNPVVSCYSSQIPRLNLQLWKSEPLGS